MKTILVLFGGCSTEYAVSLQSAHAVASHMDRAAYTPLLVGITRSGQWLYYTGPLDRLEADAWQGENCTPCTLSLDRGGGSFCCWTAAERGSTLTGPSRCSTARTGRTAPSRGCWSWRGCR